MAPFNSVEHRSGLLDTEAYLAHPNFIKTVGFKQSGNGNILVDKITRDPKIIIAIGKVINYRLRCGPAGTYSADSEFGSLATSKFQFYLAQPDEEIWQPDFKKHWDILTTIQDSIAHSGSTRRNLLEMNGQNKNIRFAMPMFEIRVCFPFTSIPILEIMMTSCTKPTPISDATIHDNEECHGEQGEENNQEDETNGECLSLRSGRTMTNTSMFTVALSLGNNGGSSSSQTLSDSHQHDDDGELFMCEYCRTYPSQHY